MFCIPIALNGAEVGTIAAVAGDRDPLPGPSAGLVP